MQHEVFTVYDQKAEAYLPPFYFTTIGQALRAFADTVNDPTHAFFKHPEDYTLFHLGYYDDGNAKFDPLVTPSSMGTALEHLSKHDATIEASVKGVIPKSRKSKSWNQ